MNIQVQALRPYQKNTLKGFATLVLPDAGLVLKECTWHEKDGKEWVGFPARQFTGQDGATKWQNLIEFAQGFDRDGWQAKAVAALRRHQQQQS
jgi:hypothetical protein